ncbi:hypothetical protein LTR56_011274 [Elasticomyces elasticus]|nr:hypothetical protein LTR56_011274 [Elasticomyces elasticus]KAK3668348.1 hypothetical protein LTR22_000639 [Elasticomyces elasticus]KAK4911025.1 hypothetical protein LTR49_020386 [Elasticomyces elasticus]KAK5756499.1 hypothetical protein LTS12_013453 [Elasticomyces elasticus]
MDTTATNTDIYSQHASRSILNTLRHHNPTTSIASTAVFATTELLEHILSSLALVDLAHAERVSRKWRDVIASSVQMKQALFMEAVPAELFATLPRASKLRPKGEVLISADKSWPIMVVDLHPAPSAASVPDPYNTDETLGAIDIDLLTSPMADVMSSAKEVRFDDIANRIQRERSGRVFGAPVMGGLSAAAQKLVLFEHWGYMERSNPMIQDAIQAGGQAADALN